MGKNRFGGAAVEDQPEVAVGSTIAFHARVPRTGPQTRTCYTIPGVPGCLVIHLSLFADGIAPDTLTLQGVRLAAPVVKVTDAAKAEAAAVKAQEKLVKAQAKINALAVKAEERRVKAEAALAKATAAAAPSA